MILVGFFYIKIKINGGVIVVRNVLIRTERKNKSVDTQAVIMTLSKEAANLEMLMEAEELYEDYEEVESSETQKVFKDPINDVEITLSICQVAELTKS